MRSGVCGRCFNQRGCRYRKTVIIDLQLNQGSAPWSLLSEAAIAAEETGYSTLWNLDHFSGTSFDSDSMLECFTSLTAWASVTTTMHVGTLVANVMNREAGLLANIVSSVQHISGNRLRLGIGAGTAPKSPWNGEQVALGLPLLPTMAQRHARLVDIVDTMKHLWSHDRHEKFHGFPRPDIVPPIIIGTNSEGLARIAGTHADGVNTRFNHPERSQLLAIAREASGHRADFDCTVWSPFVPEYADPSHPFHQELVADGVTRLVLFHKSAPDINAITSIAPYLSKSTSA